MPSLTINDDRKIIPRWRSFRDTIRTRELDGPSAGHPRVHSAAAAGFLAQRLADWKRHRTVGHASDLLSGGVALGRQSEVEEAARFLIRSGSDVSKWVREMALNALGYTPDNSNHSPSDPTATEQQLHAKIRSFRQMLRIEPNDPIAWVEIARNHTALGNTYHAQRSVLTALQLARNNRFVLRAATRFWLHEGMADKAHKVILEAESTPFDPWLIAAEIAIGGIRGGRPTLTRAARRMLTENRIPENQLTELASALATLELESGNFSKSKKLFRRSLIDPTENSVAQAVWASRKHGVSGMRFGLDKVEDSHEAQTLYAVRDGSWKDCVVPCRSWHYYQPFSKRPSILGSYVFGTALADYSSAMKFAEMGLLANPRDFLLLNNFAFAAAQCGEIDKAIRKLSIVDRRSLSPKEMAIFKATNGLVLFRTGKVDQGRKLYREARSAIGAYTKDHDKTLAALATAFHAIEELRARTGEGENIRVMATSQLRHVKDPIAPALQRQLDAI